MDERKLTACTWISRAGGVAWFAMKKRTVVLLAPVVLFGALQLIPVSRTNPPVVTPMKWDSDETKALADRACMDCHSNQTQWPWYSYVAPVSLFVVHHVEDGRHELNFDELNTMRKPLDRMMREIAEQIDEGEMPLASYYPTHPTARLTSEEKTKLVEGLRNSMAATLGE
jgi:hypothetical protein